MTTKLCPQDCKHRKFKRKGFYCHLHAFPKDNGKYGDEDKLAVYEKVVFGVPFKVNKYSKTKKDCYL